MPIRKRRKAEMVMTLNKKPRTIGYSDIQDNQESEMDHNDDDCEETERKVVVPNTDEGVEDRFNHLFIEFTREREAVRAWI